MKLKELRRLLNEKRLNTLEYLSDSNASNDIKALNLCADLTQFINPNTDLDINPKINYGEIFEVAYNHAHKNYITCKAPKGAKDTNNKYNSELKALMNCHSTIDTSLKQLEDNKGYLILLSDGIIYQLDSNIIKAHLNELKCYKNKYRLTNTFVRQYGKLNKFQFKF